jgi:23S rRNA U2552 (ribose-2'-O)-methylase RlmE/FtsJ/DNA-directed RNA polymerase subunit E'/Rpb7
MYKKQRFEYKIPKVCNTFYGISNITGTPKRRQMLISLKISEIDDSNKYISKYLKHFEGRVTSIGYIIKIIKIISIGYGRVEKYKYDPEIFYTVEFLALIFDPQPGDILVGCKIRNIAGGKINMLFENNIFIIADKGKKDYKIGDTLTCRILSVTPLLDKLKYEIESTVKIGKMERKYRKKIVDIIKKKENKFLYKDINGEIRETRKRPMPIIQFTMMGEIIDLWDLPFNFRFVKVNNNKPIKLSIEFSDTIEKYETRLHLIKKVKDKIPKEKWDKYLRGFINPYETIELNLGKTKPINRAFYKIYEICKVFNISGSKFLTLADAPGGFTQAILHLYKNAKIITISLKKSPIKYHKIIKNNNNVIINYMKNKDGDLLNLENCINFIDNLKSKFDVVTADGSLKYEKEETKEIEHMRLFTIQLMLGISSLNKNGVCLVKCFERETLPMNQLFYWCGGIFKECYLYKPQSSRIANAEVYFICRGLKNEISLKKEIKEILSVMKNITSIFSDKKITSFPEIIRFSKVLNKVRKYAYDYAFNLHIRRGTYFTTQYIDERKRELVDKNFALMNV